MTPEEMQGLLERVTNLEVLLNELQDIVLKMEKEEMGEEVESTDGTMTPKEEASE